MLNKKALAGSVSAPPAIYPEDVFSTYLYTGTGATLAINNGIDLAGKGGLVWCKGRNDLFTHSLVDSTRGISKWLGSNSISGQDTFTDAITSFNNNGFTLGADTQGGYVNVSTYNFASWTFREAPKFFDVVTYTGNGANRTIAHNLGSAPGMIVIKSTSQTSDWQVYHRSIGASSRLVLNATLGAINIGAACWNSTDPTSTVFSLGTNSNLNTSGQTYVAYLFAHNAGGFGAAGTDNVISCGSYTGNGSATGPVVTLNYEPQWLLIKRTDSTSDWNLIDNMRGFVVGGTDAELNPNLSNAESTGTFVSPTATGFQLNTTNAEYNANTATYIYMAIRRPMKTPTSGTQVFKPVAYTGTGSTRDITGVGFTLDTNIVMNRASRTYNLFSTRLQGLSANGTITTPSLASNTTDAELTVANSINGTSSSAMDGYTLYGGYSQMNSSSTDYISYNFRRATGFFDVVCFTATSNTADRISHNLGAVPELMIVKLRDTSSFSAYDGWFVYCDKLSGTPRNQYLRLNSTSAVTTNTAAWGQADPTSTTFGQGGNIGDASKKYVAYLFASVAGVSKVGSYTGNGSSQTINCEFTAGARFVMVKRTDSAGDWVVLDTARGIVSGNDPFLQLNSTAAEVTGEDIVDPANSGFIVNETTEAINTNAATYIFLAIA